MDKENYGLSHNKEDDRVLRELHEDEVRKSLVFFLEEAISVKHLFIRQAPSGVFWMQNHMTDAAPCC
jgi:hypothetical protein